MDAFGVPEADGVEVYAGEEDDGFACGLAVLGEGGVRVGHDGIDGDGLHLARRVVVCVVEFFVLPSRVAILNDGGHGAEKVIGELLYGRSSAHACAGGFKEGIDALVNQAGRLEPFLVRVSIQTNSEVSMMHKPQNCVVDIVCQLCSVAFGNAHKILMRSEKSSGELAHVVRKAAIPIVSVGILNQELAFGQSLKILLECCGVLLVVALKVFL